ncbi:hypothetical protein BLOT_001258 [Blomia tropicalis]|nr:hypothetical protein BLOT_001258 [Blomia tropicalis]
MKNVQYMVTDNVGDDGRDDCVVAAFGIVTVVHELFGHGINSICECDVVGVTIFAGGDALNVVIVVAVASSDESGFFTIPMLITNSSFFAFALALALLLLPPPPKLRIINFCTVSRNENRAPNIDNFFPSDENQTLFMVCNVCNEIPKLYIYE